MPCNKNSEFLPPIWRKPISNIHLVAHHVALGHRYRDGDDILASEMMAAAHYAAAVAHGHDSMKEHAHLMVETLSAQQIKTAALLASLFVARGRSQESEVRAAGKSNPDTDSVPSRRI